VNDTFIDNVIRRNNVIVHATVTGWGGTVFEPHVNSMFWSYDQIKKLVKLGFSSDRIVLRVDPIFESSEGLNKAESVLRLFANSGIHRVRFSFLDLYKHVKARFEDAHIDKAMYLINPISAQGFRDSVFRMMTEYSDKFCFEACAEDIPSKYQPLISQIGCISQKDLEILGLDTELKGSSSQRSGCMCPANKKELLSCKHQCDHKCLYCYWR
jgi:DNA repair photolyase